VAGACTPCLGMAVRQLSCTQHCNRMCGRMILSSMDPSKSVPAVVVGLGEKIKGCGAKSPVCYHIEAGHSRYFFTLLFTKLER
jgi:hypothetical protein